LYEQVNEERKREKERERKKERERERESESESKNERQEALTVFDNVSLLVLVFGAMF